MPRGADIINKAQHNAVRFTKLQVDKPVGVTFADLQNIHNLADLLLRLIHVLTSNTSVLRLLSKTTKDQQQRTTEKKDRARCLTLISAIDASISEHAFHHNHAELVLKRTQGIGATVSTNIKMLPKRPKD